MQLARHQRRGIDIWPGFVDALAALLIVITFLLLVFAISQFFLSAALSGKEKTLEKLNQQVTQLADVLSLERSKTLDVESQLGEVTAQLSDTETELSGAHGLIAQQEQSIRETLGLIAAKETALSEKDRIVEEKNRAIAAQAQLLRERVQTIEEKLGIIEAQDRGLREKAQTIDEKTRTIEEQDRALRERAQAIEAKLRIIEGKDRSLDEQAQTIDEKTRTIEEQDRVLREREQMIEEKLGAIAVLQNDIALLREVRGQLEQDVAGLALQLKDREQTTHAEQEISATALAQVEVLNRQVKALRDQLTAVSEALGFDLDGHEEDLTDLVKRLNVALVRKTRELAAYRSDFFGRLRKVLGDNPDVRIVGDRFVIQSGLLFESASADVGSNGRKQLTQLAGILKSVATEIPDDIDWVLRIDGHTDRRAINTPQFPSNWELSSARAISIVTFLVDNGIPPEHLAATGFGEFHPIDPAENEQAYARNRRIEIKLTAR